MYAERPKKPPEPAPALPVRNPPPEDKLPVVIDFADLDEDDLPPPRQTATPQITVVQHHHHHHAPAPLVPDLPRRPRRKREEPPPALAATSYGLAALSIVCMFVPCVWLLGVPVSGFSTAMSGYLAYRYPRNPGFIIAAAVSGLALFVGLIASIALGIYITNEPRRWD